MPSFFAALRSYLKTVPELSELTDIYSDEVPEQHAFPFMIISELFEIPHGNLTDDYYVESALQFTIQARLKGDSKRLAKAAYAALWRNKMPTLVFDEGYEMDGRERGQYRGPRAATGRPEGDKVWQASFDYSFLLGIRVDV